MNRGAGGPHANPLHAMSFLQIIANHHMQSISFASGGDTVRHAHLSPPVAAVPQGQWGQGLPVLWLS